MKTLYLIPARGGSKGVPGKNIKLLNNKTLIAYSIDIAKQFTDVSNICVSSDDDEIIKAAENEGLVVPFIRPDYLASDTATSYDVIMHALKFYEEKSVIYDNVVLLQPTSPFRHKDHLAKALDNYSNEIDAIISVCETKSNPYYVLFEENNQGFLKKSKEIEITRRQDAPKVYEFNGSIYVLNVASLKKYKSISKFEKIRKIEMPHYYSIDIDNMEDWMYCEFIIEKNLLS
jgi:CMP-N,N'-diacetyllegionaminic acid synthase